MRAVVLQADQTVKVEEVPLPGEPGEGELLVKVHVIGHNIADNLPIMHGRIGARMGSDAAGIVEKVGPGVNESYLGKTVAFVKIEGGAWAEYVLIKPNKTDYMIILPTSVEAAGGASLPIPVLTIFSTFIKLGLPPMGQLEGQKPGAGQWMLIWSASTAVGLVAVQLAKIYGFKVVATASSKKHDIVTAYGADCVFDYRDADVASKIKQITSNTLAYGIDCITKEGSTELCQQCFPTADEGKRGQLVLMLWPAPPSVNDNVDTKIAINIGENNLPKYSDYYSEEDQKVIRQQCKDLTSYLESGQFKPLPVTDVPGLDKVQEVMHSVRTGTHPSKMVQTIT